MAETPTEDPDGIQALKYLREDAEAAIALLRDGEAGQALMQLDGAETTLEEAREAMRAQLEG